MARLIELGQPSSCELRALHSLKDILPSDVLTTPFWDDSYTEYDSILLCSMGPVYLELKEWRGVVTPIHFKPWQRDISATTDPNTIRNPFQQGSTGAKKLAAFFRDRLGTRLPTRVDYLIVLTHTDSVLDLFDRSVTEEDKKHVALLRDVPDHLRFLLIRQTPLTAGTLARLLSLLDPAAATEARQARIQMVEDMRRAVREGENASLAAERQRVLAIFNALRGKRNSM